MELVECPECGGAAEAESWSSLSSTGERMEHVKILCVRRHWFLMPRETLMRHTASARTRAEKPVRD
ncbi:MAG TPA: hypothetical protein VGD11_13150 [Mycobacteriales bacterium]|jgi:hypothetical protein